MDSHLKGKRILVVDDEPDSLNMLRILLERSGAKVFTASNGQEGFNIARTEVPDLILVDIFMPGLNGWEFIQLVKDFAPTAKIPNVAVSVHGEADYRQRAINAGFTDFISKPINPVQLIDKLKKHLTNI